MSTVCCIQGVAREKSARASIFTGQNAQLSSAVSIECETVVMDEERAMAVAMSLFMVPFRNIRRAEFVVFCKLRASSSVQSSATFPIECKKVVMVKSDDEGKEFT